jgi:hypothetical protein
MAITSPHSPPFHRKLNTMNTYSSIKRGLRMLASFGLVPALAMTGLGPASAAPVHYTCVADVSTGLSPAVSGQSGAANLATGPVTGATITQAASACHAFAHAAFMANAAWSDPAQFCARYSQANYENTLGNSGKTRLVWVTDYFQELGHANGYNRVGGYSVVCNGPAQLIQIPTNPTVVPTRL